MENTFKMKGMEAIEKASKITFRTKEDNKRTSETFHIIHAKATWKGTELKSCLLTIQPIVSEKGNGTRHVTSRLSWHKGWLLVTDIYQDQKYIETSSVALTSCEVEAY